MAHIYANGKFIDSSPIRSIPIQSENGADTVTITVDKTYEGIDLETYDFRISGEINGSVVDADLEKTVNDDTIDLVWVISDIFTSVCGKLFFNIVAEKDGSAVIYYASPINISPSYTARRYSELTALPEDIIFGKTAVNADGTVTGTLGREEINIVPELVGKTVLPSEGKLISKVTLADFPGDITGDATANTGDIISGKTAYCRGEKVTGSIPVKTSENIGISGGTVSFPSGYYATEQNASVANTSNPAVTLSFTNGLITASVTQSAGYTSGSSQNKTQLLTTRSASEIIPGISDTVIPGGVYLTGVQTVRGNANLIPENIKNGTEIFGVVGSYNGSELYTASTYNGIATVEYCSMLPGDMYTVIIYGNFTSIEVNGIPSGTVYQHTDEAISGGYAVTFVSGEEDVLVTGG